LQSIETRDIARHISEAGGLLGAFWCVMAAVVVTKLSIDSRAYNLRDSVSCTEFIDEKRVPRL
jgi:hypothetical protein